MLLTNQRVTDKCGEEVGKTFPSFPDNVLKYVWAGGEVLKFFRGLGSLETPAHHSLGQLSCKAAQAGEMDALRFSLKARELSGTTNLSQPYAGLSLDTGFSPDTHSIAWTLGQAHLKSPVGSQCGKLETGRVAWLCPNSMGSSGLDIQAGVSSQASPLHTLLVGTGKPLWLSWPSSSFSSFGSQATPGPH